MTRSRLHHINYKNKNNKNSPGGTKTPYLKPHLAFPLSDAGWVDLFLLDWGSAIMQSPRNEGLFQSLA